MDKKSVWTWILAALKGLPLIRFALMLGGGVVATIGSTHAFLWLGYHDKFPANDTAVWLARIQGVVWLGLAFASIIFVVMLTLAWGKVNGVRGSIGGASIDLDFDDEGDDDGEGSRVGSGYRGPAGGGWAGGDPDAGGHEPQQGRRRRRG